MSEVWLFLNSNAGAVQAVSTIVLVGITAVLVVITAFYAFQVRKTNELISMQIFPKIIIEPDKLRSRLLNTEQIAKIKKKLLDKKGEPHYVHFLLDYKVMNHSASYGSVERPQLLIENPKNGKNKLLLPDLRSVVIDTSLKGEVKNTIYLKAGEMKNMQEEFYFHIFPEKQLDDDIDLINNAPSLQYTILYKNVVNKQFSVELKKEQVLPSEY